MNPCISEYTLLLDEAKSFRTCIKNNQKLCNYYLTQEHYNLRIFKDSVYNIQTSKKKLNDRLWILENIPRSILKNQNRYGLILSENRYGFLNRNQRNQRAEY